MPPKAKFTKEDIIEAAVKLTRENGEKALTARNLASMLGTTAKPVFGLFSGMDEVRSEVIRRADEIYHEYLAKEMASGEYPPYKASGMGYIRFAREEKHLFRLLFMRDRSNEIIEEDRESIKPLIDLIVKNTGITESDAYRFHLEQWLFVHGIASMIATNFLLWDDGDIGNSLTRIYKGLMKEYLSEEKTNG